MKVMIEIDLPEGQKIPTADDIKRLTNPDWLAEWWHIDDIKDNYRGDMSDEQAREVLQYMEKYHDCNVGFSWDSITVWSDMVMEGEE